MESHERASDRKNSAASSLKSGRPAFFAGAGLMGGLRRLLPILTPRTTGQFLAGIMISTLIPLVLIQSLIYFFWYRTRTQTEIDANVEFARSVASAFESYVADIQRHELVVGMAIGASQPVIPEYAGFLLSALKREYSTIIRFSLVDQKGIVVASSDPRVRGVSISDQGYFREVRAGRETLVSDLTKVPLIDEPLFSVARRIEFSKGSWAVLVAVIDPVELKSLVLPMERPSQGIFSLFDREGTLVFFGGEARVGHPNWKYADPYLRTALKGRESAGTLVHPLDQKEYFVARTPIQKVGWIAGAGRPVEVATVPIYRTLVWVIALNCVILTVSLATAVGLSRFLITRVNQLREYARRIATGESLPPASIANPVELAELERSFSAMAEQIQARQSSLQKAVGDLTRSNQELEQFAYVASHDLQEPLRVITGFVQLLEKRYAGQLDETADRYIGFITDAVSRQQHLIRDLLSFSRVGRQAFVLKPIDANLAVQAALQSLRQMIKESDARITHDQLPVVQADEVQLSQLFQNLFSNAIKFRGRERPEIHVSARRGTGMYTFSVQDNGIGIEPGYWEQIFVMFKRLHTRKDYPGTGIGLAICKKIVERHGGSIWLDSKPGAGSTFYFTLMAGGEP